MIWARIKQIARCRRWYVTMSSSSLSAASASSATPSSEKTLSHSVVVELQPGHTVEFRTSRIFSGRVLEMQRLGYFGNGVRRAPEAEEVPELEVELVVFEAFLCWSSPANVSVCSRGFAEVRGTSSLVDTKCCGDAREVCLGCLLIQWAAICGGLREELLSSLAEEKNR